LDLSACQEVEMVQAEKGRFAGAGRWVLLATAVLQAVSPPVAGFDQGRPDNPVVVPPGPFFAVWGVVLLGCLVVTVRGLSPRRAADPGFRRLHVPLSIAQCGFVLWLVAADSAPALTVPVFAVMLAALVVALLRAPLGGRGGFDHPFTEAVLGVYAGWSAAAIWLNLASVLNQPSAPVLAALLTGAVISLVVLVTLVCRSTAARIAAGATGVWALLGVTLSASGASASALAVLAGAGCAGVVLAVALATTRRHSRA
jgi:hypothetical protein